MNEEVVMVNKKRFSDALYELGMLRARPVVPYSENQLEMANAAIKNLRAGVAHVQIMLNLGELEAREKKPTCC